MMFPSLLKGKKGPRPFFLCPFFQGERVQLLLTRNPKNDFCPACPDPAEEELATFPFLTEN
jgi:hypothetical protein